MGGRGLSGRRCGILGGTFDPVHYAHLTVAEQTADALSLDGVLFVPAGEPVHKPPAGVSPPEHRARMVELAIAGNPRFSLSDVELDRPGPSYSVDTVAELTRQRPEDTFVFIVSAQSGYDLPTWRDPTRLLELCEIALVPRLGYQTPTREWLAGQFPGQADRFVVVQTTPLGHSASDIRRRVRAGRSIRYLVPSAVEHYIREQRLYMADG